MVWPVSSRTDRVRSLSTTDHTRDSAGMTYVYPVVSRRTGGVSIGVNLNPNNACNWRCVYCQVPGLVAGKGPPIDLALLESELREMLDGVLRGGLVERAAPSGARRLTDLAFSGNGEPTTSPDFRSAVELVSAVRAELELTVPVVLITNGSMLLHAEVQAGVRHLARAGGEVWFKLDSATVEGSLRINSCHTPPEEHLKKLELAATLCPTWIQTCVFAWSGAPPSDAEQSAYLTAVGKLLTGGTRLSGVHLYSVARPSHQPEAPELAPLPKQWLEAFAERIRGLGLEVKVSV
jgi:wyosine [tRNA(Phe)-imidazoG37] synthetase (radical SAM superfamily)